MVEEGNQSKTLVAVGPANFFRRLGVSDAIAHEGDEGKTNRDLTVRLEIVAVRDALSPMSQFSLV